MSPRFLRAPIGAALAFGAAIFSGCVEGMEPPPDGGLMDVAIGVDGGGDAHVIPDAHRPSDAPRLDAGSDAPVIEPGTCSGAVPPALFADRVASDGTEHWLRQTATATTYVTLPHVRSRASLPAIHDVREACGDQRVLIAETAAATFTRIDFLVGTAGALHLCTRTDFTSSEAARAATPADETALNTNGCDGHAWAALETL